MTRLEAVLRAKEHAKEFVHVWERAGSFVDTLCDSWDEALNDGADGITYYALTYLHTLTDLGKIDMGPEIREEIERMEQTGREISEQDHSGMGRRL